MNRRRVLRVQLVAGDRFSHRRHVLVSRVVNDPTLHGGAQRPILGRHDVDALRGNTVLAVGDDDVRLLAVHEQRRPARRSQHSPAAADGLSAQPRPSPQLQLH